MKTADTRFGLILSYLVAISTVIGIPAGLYGYFASQHDKRVETTFEFYKQFRADAFQQDWTLLITRWNANAADAQGRVAQGDMQGLQNLVVSLVSDDKGSAAMERVLSFFDELSACVENALCDHNAAYGLLKDQAEQMADAYGPYIVFIRDKYKNVNYGSGLIKARALTKEFDPL